LALIHHGLTIPAGADPSQFIRGGWIDVIYTYPSGMAQNFWTAIIAWTSGTIVAVLMTLSTKQMKTDKELEGLVYSLTPKIDDSGVVWYKRPTAMALLVAVLTIILTIIFW